MQVKSPELQLNDRLMIGNQHLPM